MAWSEEDYHRLSPNQINRSAIMKDVWAKKKAASLLENIPTKVHPKMREAHRIFRRALRNGILKREDKCEQCGRLRDHWVHVHAHHDDYDFPLIVRWLCISCHMQWHRKHGRGKNLGAATEPWQMWSTTDKKNNP